MNSSHKWSLTLFTIGVFMAGLDNGIISTALTTINDAFNVSASWGAWSITIYTLGIAISVPIVGKLSDKYGRKRLFVTEIALFGVGSLLVAISPSFPILLLSRFIQAIGGGGIFIIGSSHILATMPKDKQGKALGMLGGMHGLSAIIGPNLGAIILNVTGTWQWMFMINIPIAIFLIVAGVITIPESKSATANALDYKGILLLSFAILAMMYGITGMNNESSIFILLFIVVGILLFAGLLFHEHQLEQRGGDPILAYSLLRTRLFQVTLILGLLSGGFLAGIIFIPSYVQQVLQVPVANAGYWLTPMAVASGIGAGLGGVMTDKQGADKTIILSGVIGCIGFVMFPFFVTGFWTFSIASVLAGVGLGILLGAPLNVLAGESARENEQGSALGTLSLTRQIGLTLFPALYAAFIAGGFSKAETLIQNTYGDKVSADLTGSNYNDLAEKITRIADPDIQHKLSEMLSNAIQAGFDRLFLTAGALSILVFATGMFLVTKGKSFYKTRS
ncbi:MFS transporter [Virgibacillus siamensis]|uniref:MFS transporter n=1 Tax=Virgibacillus siamensis TaxID=480071 RepID=UPI0009848F79|nr:MFS transporter [Virgibacillus siamensis]